MTLDQDVAPIDPNLEVGISIVMARAVDAPIAALQSQVALLTSPASQGRDNPTGIGHQTSPSQRQQL
jgi:hypothetical protein